MRTIKLSGAFTRDYRREMRGRHRATLLADLLQIAALLAADETLAWRYRDHAMVGNWRGYRNCHLRHDLILLYRKPDSENLELARLGSHSELDL